MSERMTTLPEPAEGPALDDTQFLLYARDLRIAVERERAEARDLAALNDRLRRLDRLKSDFLALIFHELRTPLTYLSNVDILECSTDSAQQREIIDVLRRGHLRLDGLITKAVECWRWSSVHEVERSRRVDFAAVVRDAVQGVVEKHGASIEFRMVVSGVSFAVGGDEAALKRAVVVLFDNAVRFSSTTKDITVEVCERGEKIHLSVADRGVGLPDALVGEIFEPFTIADVAQLSDGSGLGLATASAICRAHGGRLSARGREDGRGSVFTLELPKFGCEPPARSSKWDDSPECRSSPSSTRSVAFDGTEAAIDPVANG